MIIGYTAGVFDLFHVGHVNLLRNARAMCDRLVVGVTVDELVQYKGKRAIVPYSERIEVVRACRYADSVVAQTDLDKFAAWERLRYDVLFVGDDWYGSPNWKAYEARLAEVGVPIRYLPYTAKTSSTVISAALQGAEAHDH